MIAIVDFGRGNLLSVRNAFTWFGADVEVCQDPARLSTAERVVLPGVGAFGDAMATLRERGMVEAMDDVRRSGRPILGVCLGMQLFATRSLEGGITEGFGWFPGEVRRIEAGGLRVPHVGWNDVTPTPTAAAFRGIAPGSDFYFVHSFQLHCDEPGDVAATCTYGTAEVTAAIERENVMATQFHPEKSQEHGLALLRNFLEWTP